MGAARKFPAVVAALAMGVLASGCMSMGAQKLRPGQGREYDLHLADLRDARPGGEWLWIRARIEADFDGHLPPITTKAESSADGEGAPVVISEEAVLATFQAGDPSRPGPVRLAVVLFFRLDNRGGRTLVAREIVFDADQSPPPPRPKGVVDLRTAAQREQPPAFMEGALGAFEQVVGKRGVALASLMTDGKDDGRREVWHYAVVWPETDDAPAQTIFSIAATQRGASLWFANRAPRPAFFIDQRVLPASLDPHWADWAPEPGWVSVWSLGEDGVYRQSLRGYRSVQAGRIEAWLTAYARLPRTVGEGEVAYLEYYLGMLKRVLGEDEAASEFFRRAIEKSVSPELTAHAQAALAETK